jgi:hypothetical protein
MKTGIPEFRSGRGEFEFGSEADSTGSVNWATSERVKLPELKSTQDILTSSAKTAHG